MEAINAREHLKTVADDDSFDVFKYWLSYRENITTGKDCFKIIEFIDKIYVEEEFFPNKKLLIYDENIVKYCYGQIVDLCETNNEKVPKEIKDAVKNIDKKFIFIKHAQSVSLTKLDPEDYLLAKYFHNIYKNDFISRQIGDNRYEWFYINKFGIWKSDNYMSRFNELFEHFYLNFVVGKTNEKDFKLIKATLFGGRKKLSLIRELQPLYYSKKPFNTKPNLIGFENGVYDLKEKEFRVGNYDDMVSITTGYNYEPVEDLSKIEKFMKSLFLDEEIEEEDKKEKKNEVFEYFMMWISTSLYGVILEQDFHIWSGSGSNGKSLLISILNCALGDYFINSHSSLVTGQSDNSSSANPALVKLMDKRFNSIQEPSSKKFKKNKYPKLIIYINGPRTFRSNNYK